MQPGGERGVAAESGDFAVQLKKGFLREVFGFGDVAHHAQAQGVDAPLMKRVELREGIVVACLSPGKGVGVAAWRGWNGNRSGSFCNGFGWRRWRLDRGRCDGPRGRRFMRVHGESGGRHSFPWGLDRKAAKCCTAHHSSLV